MCGTRLRVENGLKLSRNLDTHIGEIHGIYQIVKNTSKRDLYGKPIYIVRCLGCGYERESTYGQISSPAKKIIHCNHLQCNGYVSPRISWKNKRLQRIFSDMKQRCYNIRSPDYRFYGAKGIKICDEWIRDPEKFVQWAESNGYEESLTIDRKNSKKDYSPDNCHWIPAVDNTKYKTTTRIIEVDGEVHTGRDWAVKLGLGINRINDYTRKYGIEHTKEFIKKRAENPDLVPPSGVSYYSLYMN